MQVKKNLPNGITCLGLLAGCLGIMNLFDGDITHTIYFVLAAGLFDFADGLAARLLKRKSALGMQLDSLADMVSFSVLPALFLFVFLKNNNFETAAYLTPMIVVFSALRLAKFNITTEQTDKFIGVPTPANAVFVSSLFLLEMPMKEWHWVLITLTSGFLLVAPVEMMALKFKSGSIRENRIKYLPMAIIVVAAVATAFVFWGIKTILWFMPCYITLSVLKSILAKRRVGKG